MEAGYERFAAAQMFVSANSKRAVGVSASTMRALTLAVCQYEADRGSKAVFAVARTPAVRQRRFASTVRISKLFYPLL
jgi:hypothetical protein